MSHLTGRYHKLRAGSSYVYVRYLLETFVKFEALRVHSLVTETWHLLLTEAYPRCQTKNEGFNLLKTDSVHLTYLESSLLPALRKKQKNRGNFFQRIYHLVRLHHHAALSRFYKK